MGQYAICSPPPEGVAEHVTSINYCPVSSSPAQARELLSEDIANVPSHLLLLAKSAVS